MMQRVGRADMWKWFAVAALVLLAGCAEHQVASCATTAGSSGGYAGPCWDGTDRTDRTNRDDITDRTDRRIRDDLTDRTDRRNRDDTTDRTVWCVEPGVVITAPSFMVFFDFDKSTLTPAALDTIKRAATAYKTKGGAQIKASGHTDRSGTEAYNMALSLRRVNVVRDQLVREGVPETDISVVALGESQPMVPTPDG